MKKILLAATMTVVLAGCQSTPEAEKPAGVEDRRPGTTGTMPSTAPSTGAVRPSAIGGDPLKDPSSILSKRSIYFDFDRDDIKPEFVPLVEAHGKYLRENRAAKMLIQGNADERGSREYNLGLGQRRSDAIKKRLILLGATDRQIESVSLGEEKPQCADHSEDCWYKNRRGDLLYGGEF